MIRHIVIALVILGYYPICVYSQSGKATRENYSKLKFGMTLDEAQAILGPEKEMAKTKGGLITVTWEHSADVQTTTVVATFENGVLQKKEAREESVAGFGAASGIGFYICGILSVVLMIILPIAIALYRGHPDLAAIVLIAVFFSWTIIGWWIALIWAVKSIPLPPTVNINIGGGSTTGTNTPG